MWDDGWNPDFDGPPLEERLAAFKAENGAPILGPDVELFLLHLYAALAEKERRGDLAAHEGHSRRRQGPRASWGSRRSM